MKDPLPVSEKPLQIGQQSDKKLLLAIFGFTLKKNRRHILLKFLTLGFLVFGSWVDMATDSARNRSS
jgi:hypothetical protein